MLTVMSGSVAAQFIGLLAAPIVARLYTPVEFGVFSQFTALLTIATLVATLRLEDALMLPKSEEPAFQLLVLAIASSLVFAILLGICVLGIEIVGYKDIFGSMLWALPVAVLMAGVIQVTNSWYARQHNFQELRRNSIWRAATAAVFKIALGLCGFSAVGLVLGQLLTDAALALRHIRVILRRQRTSVELGSRNLLRTARDYGDFVAYGTGQILIGAAWIQLPVLFIASYHGAQAAGLYAMALVFIQYPVVFLQTGLRQVFYPKISEIHNRGGRLLPPTAKVMAAIYAIYSLPAAVIVIAGPLLFAVVFGAAWREAGELAQILVISSLLSIGKTPAIILTRLLRRQRLVLALDASALVLIVSLYYFWGGTKHLKELIAFQAVIIGCYNTALIVTILFTAHKSDQQRGGI